MNLENSSETIVIIIRILLIVFTYFFWWDIINTILKKRRVGKEILTVKRAVIIDIAFFIGFWILFLSFCLFIPFEYSIVDYIILILFWFSFALILVFKQDKLILGEYGVFDGETQMPWNQINSYKWISSEGNKSRFDVLRILYYDVQGVRPCKMTIKVPSQNKEEVDKIMEHYRPAKPVQLTGGGGDNKKTS
ncbi:MAG: hypothetical protein JXR73_14660 [Candidatus Omnitrophica bacterium]|nr:hypothetical protein [Candidatus Omnitrophota bacterium]